MEGGSEHEPSKDRCSDEANVSRRGNSVVGRPEESRSGDVCGDVQHWTELLHSLGVPLAEVGVIVVDHGSRRAESNQMLELFATLFQQSAPFAIVEPAHMELAEPSIAQAYGRCVERGARLVLVSPFFLLPGRHWTTDIPQLTHEAARQHPDTRWLVAAPLGLHPLLPNVMLDRVERCLRRLTDPSVSCDVCESSGTCQADRHRLR